MSSESVFITGFMGSGKSTAGILLAGELGVDFFDLDTQIVERTGRPIDQIFVEDGEECFRALEAELLRESRAGAVYALGGGTLAEESNLQWALEHGVVVFLEVSGAELARRLLDEAPVRPRLRAKDGAPPSPRALQRRIHNLLERRSAFYGRAHITIAATEMELGPTVDAMAQAVRHHRATSRKERR